MTQSTRHPNQHQPKIGTGKAPLWKSDYPKPSYDERTRFEASILRGTGGIKLA